MNDRKNFSYLRSPRVCTFSEGSAGFGGLLCQTPSMTDQQFLKSSRITSILARYQRTGLVPQRMRSPIPFESQTAPELYDFQAVVEASQSLESFDSIDSDSAIPAASAPVAVEPQDGATDAGKAAEN